VLGSLQLVVYRTTLALPTGLPDSTAAALEESLAKGASLIEQGDTLGTEGLEAAREAFTIGMQIASVGAALVLAVAAVIAWRVIPSLREPNRGR